MPEDITTELVWVGTEETDVFIDAKYNDEYHPKDIDTDRPHTVLGKRAEWLLNHDGWHVPGGGSEEEFLQSLPDDLESDTTAGGSQATSEIEADTGETPAPESVSDPEPERPDAGNGMITVGTFSGDEEEETTVEGAQSSGEASDVEDAPSPSEESNGVESVTEAAEAVEEDENFSAEDFIASTDWREIRSAVTSGDVDDYLEAIAEAERGRDSPREASVLTAIEERQTALSDADGDVDAEDEDEEPEAESEADDEDEPDDEADSEAEDSDNVDS